MVVPIFPDEKTALCAVCGSVQGGHSEGKGGEANTVAKSQHPGYCGGSGCQAAAIHWRRLPGAFLCLFGEGPCFANLRPTNLQTCMLACQIVVTERPVAFRLYQNTHCNASHLPVLSCGFVRAQLSTARNGHQQNSSNSCRISVLSDIQYLECTSRLTFPVGAITGAGAPVSGEVPCLG